MTFPAKPTTQDLSDRMPKGWPSFNASMAGGNMVTQPPPFGAPGSDSEATHDVVAGDSDWIGDAHYVPDLVAEAKNTGTHTVSAAEQPAARPRARAWRKTS